MTVSPARPARSCMSRSNAETRAIDCFAMSHERPSGEANRRVLFCGSMETWVHPPGTRLGRCWACPGVIVGRTSKMASAVCLMADRTEPVSSCCHLNSLAESGFLADPRLPVASSFGTMVLCLRFSFSRNSLANLGKLRSIRESREIFKKRAPGLQARGFLFCIRERGTILGKGCF